MQHLGVQERSVIRPAAWSAIAATVSLHRGQRAWVRRAEVDGGRRPGVTTAEAERVKELEREVRELRRANEILKAAAGFVWTTRLRRTDR